MRGGSTECEGKMDRGNEWMNQSHSEIGEKMRMS